jgi:hypothetical protein
MQHAPPLLPDTVPRGLWARWVGLWTHREAGDSLALFRIACGGCVLYAVGSVVVYGMVPILWLDQADGGYKPLPSPPWLFRILGGLTPTTLSAMIVAALGSGLLLMVGLAGRLAALVALQSYAALSDINSQGGGSDDYLLTNALWLLVLARSTASLSLACRLRTGRWVGAEQVPAWPRYLAIYQLVLMYWSAGLHKVSAFWLPGGDYSALYYILQQPSWQRFDLSWLAWVYPLTQIGTAVTWFWEVSSPLLLLALWYQATPDQPGRLRAVLNGIHFRRLFVLIGLTMHVLLLLLMELGPFCWVSLSFYFCLFSPKEWRSAWQRKQPEGSPNDPSLAAMQTSRMTVFAHLLAILILLHLLAITLVALPSLGGGMNRQAWQDPTVQGEIAVWVDRLNGCGVEVTPQGLEDILWETAVRYDAVRQTGLAPFQPYYFYCGTYQAWGMFAAPHRFPTRLHIDVEKEGAWHLVYVERDPEHGWLRARLDFSRMRPLMFRHGWPGYEEDYQSFAHWVARQAARDFPEASRVRLRLYKYRTPTPAEVRQQQRPEGEFINPVILPLKLRFGGSSGGGRIDVSACRSRVIGAGFLLPNLGGDDPARTIANLGVNAVQVFADHTQAEKLHCAQEEKAQLQRRDQQRRARHPRPGQTSQADRHGSGEREKAKVERQTQGEIGK